MAYYLVLYNVDGTRHSDRVKATSAEDAEYKLRGRYPGYLKFEVVSMQQTTKRGSQQDRSRVVLLCRHSNNLPVVLAS